MEIVVLHGWNHGSENWHQVRPKLENLAHVHLLDIPSVNPDLTGAEDWDIPRFASWLSEQLADKSDVVLIGHSFGGRVATYYVTHYKHDVKALVLYGTPAIYRPMRFTTVKVRLAKMLRPFVPGFIKRRFGNREYVDAKDSGRADLFKRAVTFDQTESLPKIKTPTLLLWGERDQEVPVEIAVEMNKTIKNSHLVILPGGSHNVHLESPDLFYAKIKYFVENL